MKDYKIYLGSFSMGADPEEMKKMQEEMRNQPQPSLAGLLGGKSK